jgi:type II secretory pathway pseudopilin PulG
LLRGRGPAGRAAALPCQAGFSLVEALVALSITSLAGAVLLLAVESSLGTTTEAVHRTIADGIAQQTLHEILTKRYTEKGESPLLGAVQRHGRLRQPGDPAAPRCERAAPGDRQ